MVISRKRLKSLIDQAIAAMFVQKISELSISSLWEISTDFSDDLLEMEKLSELAGKLKMVDELMTSRLPLEMRLSPLHRVFNNSLNTVLILRGQLKNKNARNILGMIPATDKAVKEYAQAAGLLCSSPAGVDCTSDDSESERT